MPLFFLLNSQIAYEILKASRCRTIFLCLLGVITKRAAGRCAVTTMSLNNIPHWWVYSLLHVNIELSSMLTGIGGLWRACRLILRWFPSQGKQQKIKGTCKKNSVNKYLPHSKVCKISPPHYAVFPCSSDRTMKGS